MTNTMTDEVIDKAVELFPCPFCGENPTVHRQGNQWTKSRKLIIKCPGCRIQLTNAAIRYGFDWLEKISSESWNTRAAAKAEDVWRCFHCDESFTTSESAAEHFGTSERQFPACTIDIAAYREMEQRRFRYQEEDTDLHRAMYRMENEHKVALRREEERGYARGLQDAKLYPEEASKVIESALAGDYFCGWTSSQTGNFWNVFSPSGDSIGVHCTNPTHEAEIIRQLAQHIDAIKGKSHD